MKLIALNGAMNGSMNVFACCIVNSTDADDSEVEDTVIVTFPTFWNDNVIHFWIRSRSPLGIWVWF